MKKKILAVLSALLVLILVSCDWGHGNSPTEDEKIAGILGDVNKIYYGTSARYMDGQVIQNLRGYKAVRFESHLVEYKNLKSVYDNYRADYVEQNTENNAMMHHGYDVDWQADKRYVEIATYTDVSTNKPVFREIRVFYGNFWETYESSYWYAKSVIVDPLMIVDLVRGVFIDTGNPVSKNLLTKDLNNAYVYEGEQDARDLLGLFGDLDTLYAYTDDNGDPVITTFTNGDNEEVSKWTILAEYTNLTDTVQEYFASKTCNAGSQINVLKYDNRYYISVTKFEGAEWSNYSVRLFDKNAQDQNQSWKSVSVTTESDFEAIANGTYNR